jgi:hypothetical protein
MENLMKSIAKIVGVILMFASIKFVLWLVYLGFEGMITIGGRPTLKSEYSHHRTPTTQWNAVPTRQTMIRELPAIHD